MGKLESRGESDSYGGECQAGLLTRVKCFPQSHSALVSRAGGGLAEFKAERAVLEPENMESWALGGAEYYFWNLPQGLWSAV